MTRIIVGGKNCRYFGDNTECTENLSLPTLPLFVITLSLSHSSTHSRTPTRKLTQNLMGAGTHIHTHPKPPPYTHSFTPPPHEQDQHLNPSITLMVIGFLQ